MAEIKNPLIVFIPDTRGVEISKYGKGNLKIGPSVYTYSRMPGLPGHIALGWPIKGGEETTPGDAIQGTCPGSSPECREICYAARPVAEMGAVSDMWMRNSWTDAVPPIPAEATLLRLHVSGDFNTVAYVKNWIIRLIERPDVRMWAYTRSWRVAELLPSLERLRALPNVQLFASMDQSMAEVPPQGWRRAWIDGDTRAGVPVNVVAHRFDQHDSLTKTKDRNIETFDGTMSFVCPEETKHAANCESCRYCITGERNDVTFLRH